MNNLNLDKSKMYYLASPFSHNNVFVRFKRFWQITRIGAKLVKLGYHIIPPITSSYLLGILGDIKGDFETWKSIDLHYIDVSDAVIVITMDGWNRSKGVVAEIKHAQTTNKPIYYISPNLKLTWTADV